MSRAFFLVVILCAGCVHEKLIDGHPLETPAAKKAEQQAELASAKLSDADIATLQAISAESTGCDASLIKISEYQLIPPSSQTWWAACINRQYVCASESVPICQKLHAPAATAPEEE